MARTKAFLISNLCPLSIFLSHDSGACVEYLMLARKDATGYLLAKHSLSHLCRRKRRNEARTTCWLMFLLTHSLALEG